jgi:UDP-GlcNAc:undecaprenyl-phosphate GlcNAc-1-phosphate transferase
MNKLEASDLAVLMSSSFLITLVAIILLRPIAFKFGLIDLPCSRKRHQGEIPIIGGLAIYFCITYIILTRSVDVSVNIAFFTAVTIIVATGLIDDIKNLNFKARFAAEIVAALIMIKWGGIEITSLGNLFGFGEIQLSIFSTLFTVFAIVGGINAFNMIDGTDGLAGGTAFIIYFLLSILSIIYNSANSLLFCFVLAPATAAFLLFNFPIPGRKKASAFLGDTGSMLLGFTICWLVISASQGDNKIISPVTVLWLIATPILDSFCIMIRRIRKGRSPFSPDREHFHHILQVVGYGKYAILFIILSFAATLAIIGIAGDVLFNIPESVMFYLFILIFALYYWAMSHAWKMVKVARYLREYKIDRRKHKSLSERRKNNSLCYFSIHPLPFADRRILTDRRSGINRRHQATESEIKFALLNKSVLVTIQRMCYHLPQYLLGVSL